MKVKRPSRHDLAYQRRHRRVFQARGKAAQYGCDGCSEMAAEWAQLHGTDGEHPFDYVPLCHKCHKRYDGVSERMRDMGGAGTT